jgi:hypothetical protein
VGFISTLLKLKSALADNGVLVKLELLLGSGSLVLELMVAVFVVVAVV